MKQIFKNYLSHVLKEHVSWDFIVRVSSKAVFEVIHVEPKVDQTPHSLPGHASARPRLLQLTPGGKNTLEIQDKLK